MVAAFDYDRSNTKRSPDPCTHRGTNGATGDGANNQTGCCGRAYFNAVRL